MVVLRGVAIITILPHAFGKFLSAFITKFIEFLIVFSHYPPTPKYLKPANNITANPINAALFKLYLCWSR